jgi:predicted RNA-binding Zn-ribbon protein involved in translation (DUF1610 family)
MEPEFEDKPLKRDEKGRGLFGVDICQDCGEEISREDGLKLKCPKCKAMLRNPEQ